MTTQGNPTDCPTLWEAKIPYCTTHHHYELIHNSVFLIPVYALIPLVRGSERGPELDHGCYLDEALYCSIAACSRPSAYCKIPWLSGKSLNLGVWT